MGRPRSHAASLQHQTRALVVGRVATGDADIILTLFTEQLGRVSAIARHAKRSQRRFGGALEPLHTIVVQLSERAGAELMSLREAKIELVRTKLLSNLEAMEAAGRALGWLRRAAPERAPETRLWRHTITLLDALNSATMASAAGALAAYGLALLESIGWGLELEACVGCGAPCPQKKPAFFDPTRGGLVCRACGGGPSRIGAPLRLAMAEARNGEMNAVGANDAAPVIELVEATLAAHAS